VLRQAEQPVVQFADPHPGTFEAVGLHGPLTDLRERGLLERTLVVVMGEFGRTPKINQPRGNPGRQHWPSCWSAILAGGGIRGGAV
jgi:uncharacterized protein (DUF1501 family)